MKTLSLDPQTLPHQLPSSKKPAAPMNRVQPPSVPAALLLVPEVNPGSSGRQDPVLFHSTACGRKPAQKRDGRAQTGHMGRERQGGAKGDACGGVTLPEGTSPA